MDFSEIIRVFGPTLLVLCGGAIGWFIKFRSQELKSIEETMREERRKLYVDILSPYILIFSDPAKVNEAINRIKTEDYRKIAFEMLFIGSDEVIKSYNSLMGHIFKVDSKKEKKDPIKLFELWGKLLLEIRKDLGNKKTSLNEKDMFRSMIKDFDENLFSRTRDNQTNINN